MVLGGSRADKISGNGLEPHERQGRRSSESSSAVLFLLCRLPIKLKKLDGGVVKPAKPSPANNH